MGDWGESRDDFEFRPIAEPVDVDLFARAVAMYYTVIGGKALYLSQPEDQLSPIAGILRDERFKFEREQIPAFFAIQRMMSLEGALSFKSLFAICFRVDVIDRLLREDKFANMMQKDGLISAGLLRAIALMNLDECFDDAGLTEEGKDVLHSLAERMQEEGPLYVDLGHFVAHDEEDTPPTYH